VQRIAGRSRLQRLDSVNDVVGGHNLPLSFVPLKMRPTDDVAVAPDVGRCKLKMLLFMNREVGATRFPKQFIRERYVNAILL
jgi:hypothetical protein